MTWRVLILRFKYTARQRISISNALKVVGLVDLVE